MNPQLTEEFYEDYWSGFLQLMKNRSSGFSLLEFSTPTTNMLGLMPTIKGISIQCGLQKPHDQSYDRLGLLILLTEWKNGHYILRKNWYPKSEVIEETIKNRLDTQIGGFEWSFDDTFSDVLSIYNLSLNPMIKATWEDQFDWFERACVLLWNLILMENLK